MKDLLVTAMITVFKLVKICRSGQASLFRLTYFFANKAEAHYLFLIKLTRRKALANFAVTKKNREPFQEGKAQYN
jgi:hypothetical protein